MENLADQSRAPQSHPPTVSEKTEQRIVELRTEHARWGPKKLWHWLEREEPDAERPAISTLGVAEEPNQVGCTDYKGWFRCGNGQVCYPLTLTDAASRY